MLHRAANPQALATPAPSAEIADQFIMSLLSERASVSQQQILVQVEQQKQSWQEHYKNMQAASVGTSVSEEDLVWALECVRSRAFSGPYSGWL